MIPMPTKFAELRSRSTGPWSGAWIVKITAKNNIGDDRTIYLSDTDMQLGTDHVYGFLESVSEFGRGLDVYKLTYNAARAVITLSDRHYHRTSGTIPARLSDKLEMAHAGAFGDWNGLHHALVELLIYPGSYATLIADCLSVYQGVVTRYTAQGEKLIIYTDERRKVVHRDLPQRKFTRTLFPKMPAEVENETMPLVYGDHWEQEVLRKTGFAPADRIADWKWLVADHVIDAFPTEHRHGATGVQGIMIWIDELQCWAKSYAGVTFNVNDSGRATFTIDPDAAAFDVYVYPSAAYPTSTGTDSANPVGLDAVKDFDASSKMSILANSTNQAEVIFEWRQQGDESDDLKNNSIAEIPGPATTLFGFQLYGSKPGAITISSINLHFWDGVSWIAFGSPVVGDLAIGEFKHYEMPANYAPGGAQGLLFWHFGTGYSSAGSPDRKPFKVRVRFNGSGWTANSTVVAYVHETRFVQSCRMPKDSAVVGYKLVRRDAYPNIDDYYLRGRERYVYDRVAIQDIDAQIIGAPVQGREYGSWIDLGGRSNSHNAGQQITTAPGIVESLLRDELGVPTGDIDMPSFDAALTDTTYSRTAKLHLKSGARRNSKNIIETLCWEHGMALVHRPNGQLRLLRIPGSGELVATLTPDDIYEQVPTIETTDVAVIRNEITFYYNRMADSGKYLRSRVVGPTLAVSQSRYGVIPDEFQLQSLSDITSSNRAIYDYLLDAYAILARPHMIVKFTARGFRFAHAEIGDRYRFAPLETREVRQRFGQSWSSVDLMIYEMLYKTNGIQFTCIKWTPE